MTAKQVPARLLGRLRKVLHKHPELSGEEQETAKKITGFLKSCKPSQVIEGIGGNGVAAVYQYYGTSPTILIRCELDALPIQEINEFDYKSVTPGVSHKCGHDGHMAIVAGLASALGKDRPRQGRVVLLFQPAEEDGRGADWILNDERFAGIEPDYVFALHNLPGYDKHEIVCRPGYFTAAVRSLVIDLKGKTAHAGEPENGANPALAIADILQATQQLEQPADSGEFALITPIQITLGEEAYGISAGEGILRLTLRTWDNDRLERLTERTEELARAAASKHGLGIELTRTHEFTANRNDDDMVGIVKQAAEANGFTYTEKPQPFRWGEDFGSFTDRYRGAMFGLGAGKDTPALHNPDYDFPEDIIPSGVLMFKSIIDQLIE